MIKGFEICEIGPPTSLAAVFERKPARIWCLGDATLLERRLLGIICARRIDSDLALKSFQLLQQLASFREIAFVGGWHSPSEQEALHILLAEGASIVFCIPKALNRFALTVELENRISHGQALLLTHCSPKVKRISRYASIRRNQLVVGLAAALLVLSAPPGSGSLKLAMSALRRGKPVLTPEHALNNDLLDWDALPASYENIRAVLG